MDTEVNLEQALDLIGRDCVPLFRSLPAAWWITTSDEQCDAYERWRADYEAHAAKVDALCKSLGLEGSAQAYYSALGDSSVLTGLSAEPFRRNWYGKADPLPVPPGWRIDSKSGYLVPSRKTKADRESQANKDWAALRQVPNIFAYISGLPSEIYLDDRDFGGTMYRVQVRRGEKCLMAFSGGDPDRQPEKSMNRKFEAFWERQPLSVLHQLHEWRVERDG